MRRQLLTASLMAVLAGAGSWACGGSTAEAGETGGRIATSPGVSGTMRGSMIDASRNTRFAFGDLGIATVREDNQGERIVVEGKKESLDITVIIYPQSPAITVVEVRARATETEYDNAFGQELLNKIIG